MATYDNYIKGLRDYGAKGDFDRLKVGIEARVGRQKVIGRLSAAGALALILISFVFYLNFGPYLFGGNDTYADYVFERSEVNGDKVLSYVFMN